MQRSYEDQKTNRDPQSRLVVHIPMTFKKRSGRRKMILQKDHAPENGTDDPTVDKQQAIAIALGHRWMDLLINGTFHSVQELAEAVGMDPSQVRRVLGKGCGEEVRMTIYSESKKVKYVQIK